MKALALFVSALVFGLVVGTTTTAQSTTAQPRQTYGQALDREAQVYMTPGQSWRWLPGDECSRWTYQGRSTKNKTNGKDIWSVKSRVNKNTWFTYKTAPAQGLNKKGQCPA